MTRNWQFNPDDESFQPIISYFGGDLIYQSGNKFILINGGLSGTQSERSKNVYELKLE